MLLLPFIQTGVNGDENLILAGKSYAVSFPCHEEFICFHMWQFSTNDYIAIVKNGEIKLKRTRPKTGRCILEIKDLSIEDVGHYHCQPRPDFVSQHYTPSSISESNLTPAKMVSLHCVLLAYVESRSCITELNRRVWLTWVDEADAAIPEDSEHQINYQSNCDVTLIVTSQVFQHKKFRCSANVAGEIKTSVDFPYRAVGGRGRGMLMPPTDPEQKDGNQEVIGGAVASVGGVVLMAVVALFVVNQRRANNQLPDDTNYTTNADNNENEDDVVYTEIILPAGSEIVRNHECHSTDYASIRTAA
ncbi:hypothetical protein LDENG_00149110 [Lucifuga dentata]|nr:hypothetical protein LDENG_00149110 [Lucifuga dentata]